MVLVLVLAINQLRRREPEVARQPDAAPSSRAIFLGHGASGDASSMAPFVDGLGARGLTADAVDLPKRRAEDAVAPWRAAVPDGPATVAGGHSYGGGWRASRRRPGPATAALSCSAT